MPIKKAIIPVGGLGTRFLPASKAQPKEMLAVVDKPVIQYIVEEAVAAGIEEIVFVTAIGKRAIEDHFDRNFELEYRLEQKSKEKELEGVKKIGKLAKFGFVRQAKPLGDGHAILTALPFIDKNEPVAVLFGDDIMTGENPGIGQLVEAYNKHEKAMVGLVEVPKEDVSKYGVIGGEALEGDTWKVNQFVEKPALEDAPSNLITPGRYIITPEIFNLLQTQTPGKDGEIRLADALITHLQNDGELLGQVMKGKRYDCGNKLGFLEAQIELGLAHPEIGDQFKNYLDSRS